MSVSSVHSAPPLGPRTIGNQQQQRRQAGAPAPARSPASSFEQELSTVNADGKRKGTPDQGQTGGQGNGRKLDLSA